MLYITLFLELVFILLFLGTLNKVRWFKNLPVSVIFYILVVVIGFIFGGQLASVYHTGKYIEVLTLTNIQHPTVVGNKVILSSCFLAAFCILFSVIVYTCQKALHVYVRLSVCVMGLFFLILNPISPFKSFIQVTSSYFKENLFVSNWIVKNQQKRIYGKNFIYSNHLPIEKNLDIRGKNIVVIFAEGFSSEWIDMNNSYKNLTPHLTAFLQKSFRFENYYSHTAATFRGLRGQLTSSYQFRGGYNYENDGFEQIDKAQIKKILSSDLIGVPQLLKDNGYHPYFLSTHHDNAKLNCMLKTLEFNRVYSADDFHNSEESLSDQEMFSALADLILERKLESPYFIGFYNYGTHLGQNSPDIKYADGNNLILNAIHNFDDAFGKFLKKVENQQDLVIIFTADHAAFPSRLYNETFGTNRTFFVDKIPFAIWYQGIKPRIVDANGRNSLDFAPTLLNALKINSGFNYFLGCSLFDKECPYQFEYITNIGEEFYKTPEIAVMNIPILIQKIKDFYHLSESQMKKRKEK